MTPELIVGSLNGSLYRVMPVFNLLRYTDFHIFLLLNLYDQLIRELTNRLEPPQFAKRIENKGHLWNARTSLARICGFRPLGWQKTSIKGQYVEGLLRS
jgi:hypothetical protein